MRGLSLFRAEKSRQDVRVDDACIADLRPWTFAVTRCTPNLSASEAPSRSTSPRWHQLTWADRAAAPGGQNQELLFHMLFGYLVVRRLLPMVKGLGLLPPRVSQPFAAILNASTRPFDLINYAGSVAGGRALSPDRMVRWLDSVTAQIERDLDRQSAASLRRGMHFPTRWDPYFKDFMTLADTYHYPTQHFDHHDRQLSS